MHTRPIFAARPSQRPRARSKARPQSTQKNCPKASNREPSKCSKPSRHQTLPQQSHADIKAPLSPVLSIHQEYTYSHTLPIQSLNSQLSALEFQTAIMSGNQNPNFPNTPVSGGHNPMTPAAAARIQSGEVSLESVGDLKFG
jgi:hypothetical protein